MIIGRPDTRYACVHGEYPVCARERAVYFTLASEDLSPSSCQELKPFAVLVVVYKTEIVYLHFSLTCSIRLALCDLFNINRLISQLYFTS